MSKRNVVALRRLALAIVTGAAFSCAVAEESRYEMSFYVDRPGGAEIGAGDYDGAIAAAKHGARGDSAAALVAATNLCVAYTATSELDRASEACESAVTLARRAEQTSWRVARVGSTTAKALNNRGVVRALSADTLGAADDLRRAARSGRGGPAPERNLAVLEGSLASRPAVARSARD